MSGAFTYGYIREATMAHLDLDEAEAQAMNLQSRFHIFANEAMQAICGGKPKYEYLKAIVVKEYWPMVKDRTSGIEVIREATPEEIEQRATEEPLDVVFLTSAELREYYVNLDTYEVGDKVGPSSTFIGFANKQVWKLIEREFTPEEIFELQMRYGASMLSAQIRRVRAELDHDYSYVGRNHIKFYKPGTYLVPAKYMWFRFESGISDDTEIDMPSDIFLTIPLYIASICLQIDNPQKANVKRAEFEMALGRCTNPDFMELNEIKASWD